jgi:hypothetical protein
MTFVAYHDTVGGSAEIDLGSTVQVLFMGMRLVTVGSGVRYLELGVTDHVLRAGWVSLGDHFDIGDGTDRNYWRAPIWADFEHTLWTPVETNVGTSLDPITVLASRLRYSFIADTTAEILVLGL